VLYVAIRPVGGSWRDIWPIYVWPVVTGGAAILAGMFVGRLVLPRTIGGYWGRLVLVPIVSCIVYAPLVRWTTPDSWDEVVGRIGRVLGRRRDAREI
jgi:hypothetical protein